ncbi:MAG: hypothetical protein E2590_09405 [Chryseobacterium sp.]|nr:hypothetical protein [Chryseobacterium sp.]
MNLESRKIEFVQAFLNLQNEELISQFEKLLKKAKQSEKELKPFTIEELNERIAKSEEDFEKGRFKTQEELDKISSNW